jgi:hypothetical protein
MIRGTLIGILVVFPMFASAQLEEIVVTGSRATRSSEEMPAVTVPKVADFLVQDIRLVNDSRSPDMRKQEIVGTIQSLMKQAARSQNIELSYGQGFLLPINLSEEALEVIEDNKRTDTSYVDIYVKVKFDPKLDAKAQITALRKFISGASKVGRTEIDSLGDIGLSIVNPERYRYEVITAISEEVGRLNRALGVNCKLLLAGLEGRVQWERTSVSELTLYIPYKIELSECSR